MRKFLAILLLTMTSLVLIGCKPNIPNLGNVHGTILDSHGKQFDKEITVTLEPLATLEDGKVGWSFEYQLSHEYNQRKMQMLVKDGEFLFLDVEPGPYSILVEVPGFPVNWGPGFTVEPGKTIEQTITIK